MLKAKNRCQLSLTSDELIHLRDLFSVTLDSQTEDGTTVSQILALHEQRGALEENLWRKLVIACEKCHIPTGKAAPNFNVQVNLNPSIDVLRDGISQETTDEVTDD